MSQGLIEPCFIINIPGSNVEKGRKRSKHNITINLIYMEDTDNLDRQSVYYNLIDTLYRELELIEVDNEIFTVKNLIHHTVDDTLHFIFDVSYSYVEIATNDNLMSSLNANSEVKENA